MMEEPREFWCKVYLFYMEKGSMNPSAWADKALADFEDRFCDKKPATETEVTHEN